jgi:hypothetical protein
MAFRPDTLIPREAIKDLFTFFDRGEKGTLVSIHCQVSVRAPIRPHADMVRDI